MSKTPSHAEVVDTLRIILVETRGLEEHEVVEEATLFADLTLESIDFLEISWRIEERFGFPLDTDELGKLLNWSWASRAAQMGEEAETMGWMWQRYFPNVQLETLDGYEPRDDAKLRQSITSLLTFGWLVSWTKRHLLAKKLAQVW
ncbi:acyl carrier protein [Candidatus Uhrbacteria bacterium]|nr:acyl carrier protein [Candidatus Uhrbacteria bacterium]